MQAPTTAHGRRVLVTRTGGTEVLQLVTMPLPIPAPNEVRLRVEYTAIAFADLMARKGRYPGAPKLPFSPGYDVVGVVDAAGADVTIPRGTRVVGICPHFGGAADSVCLDAALVLEVPEGVEAREAVCLPLNYLTAHAMLHRDGAARAGQTMFVQSAAGGVGSALVQLGVAAGLRVYGATSEAKQVLVAALGATPLSRKVELREQLLALEPHGVDLAFDSAGSASAEASLALVKPGGTVMSFGFMGDVARSKLGLLLAFLRLIVWLPLRSRSRRFRFVGHVVDRMVKDPTWYRSTLAALLDQVRTGQLKPIIGAEFPLEDLGRAQALLESGQATGKVVVRVAPMTPLTSSGFEVARRPGGTTGRGNGVVPATTG